MGRHAGEVLPPAQRDSLGLESLDAYFPPAEQARQPQARLTRARRAEYQRAPTDEERLRKAYEAPTPLTRTPAALSPQRLKQPAREPEKEQEKDESIDIPAATAPDASQDFFEPAAGDVEIDNKGDDEDSDAARKRRRKRKARDRERRRRKAKSRSRRNAKKRRARDEDSFSESDGESDEASSASGSSGTPSSSDEEDALETPPPSDDEEDDELDAVEKGVYSAKGGAPQETSREEKPGSGKSWPS